MNLKVKLLAVLVVAGLPLSACGDARLTRPATWRWPWSQEAIAPPEAVSELLVQVAEGSAPSLPQYWERNTLRVDLSALSGSGNLTLAPRAGSSWPIRLAFSPRAGSIGQLEVSGVQRVQFAVPASGEALSFELPPGVYANDTATLRVSWRP